MPTYVEIHKKLTRQEPLKIYILIFRHVILMADFKFNNVPTMHIILARKDMTIYSPYGISSNDSLEGLGLNENNLNISVFVCFTTCADNLHPNMCFHFYFLKGV